MAFTNVWDNTQPPDTQAANLLGQDLRNFRVDVQQRMSAISGLDANKPNFEAVFAGVLYFATDTAKIYQWSGAAWVDVTTSIITTPTLLRSSNGALVIPANYLAVNSMILLETIGVRGGSNTVETVGFTIGGQDAGTEGLVGLNVGDFLRCRSIINVNSIGAAANYTGTFWGMTTRGTAVTAALGSAINSTVNSTGNLTILSLEGQLTAVVYK